MNKEISSPNLQLKLQKLKSISNSMALKDKSRKDKSINPGLNAAKSLGFAAYIASTIIAFLFEIIFGLIKYYFYREEFSFGQLYFPNGIILIPMAFGLIAFAFAFLKNKNETWNSFIDKKLSEYDPSDKDSFLIFQKSTRADGDLNSLNMATWVAAETLAIEREANYKNNFNFLFKKV